MRRMVMLIAIRRKYVIVAGCKPATTIIIPCGTHGGRSVERPYSFTSGNVL